MHASACVFVCVCVYVHVCVCVRRGDGQHPRKSEVDIRPDVFAVGLTKNSAKTISNSHVRRVFVLLNVEPDTIPRIRLNPCQHVALKVIIIF